MTTHSLYRMVGVALVACAVPTVCHAQYPPSRQLSTTVEVKDGLQRPEGLSFELFGSPSAIDFVIVIVNDSPETVIFPASFTTNLGLRVERAGRAIPTKVTWERIEVALPDDDSAGVSPTTPFNVASEGVARFHGVLAATSTGTFTPGDYSVLLDLRRSVAGVRDGAGKPWTGHYGEEASIAIRVTEPQTPADQRRASLAAANAAMLKGDAPLALRQFTDMLRADPNDIEAQYGTGQAYLDLRRYREAAAAFEGVISRLPKGERSAVYENAVFAYLALGEDSRAEAILTNRYGAAAGKRRLAQLREAVRKR